MVDYGKVRSTVKPEPIVIDDFSVWQHTEAAHNAELGELVNTILGVTNNE